jgi:3-(3-hydroxy-phenyl)propionate hydroxylase
MNSGIRDVTNLGWKLAAVVHGQANEGLLGSYDAERRGHAEAMVSFATRIGKMYSPRSTATERVRDLGFRALQLVPGAKDYILQMKYKPMPRYRSGVVVGASTSPHDPVGRMFSQPVVGTADRRREKLDNVIGTGFAVVGVFVDPVDHVSAESRVWWQSLAARFVHVVRSREVPRPAAAGQPIALAVASGSDVVVEDVDGAFRDWILERPGDEIIVLRPDRYVAAVCDRNGLDATTSALRALLTRQGGSRAR